SHELTLLSSAILTAASPWARKRSAQIEASAATLPSCEAAATRLSALPPVTQPPQVKPMMAAATAPTTAPWIEVLVLIGRFMNVLSRPALRRPNTGPTRQRAADDQQ